MDLTPGVPSEQLLTAEALPSVDGSTPFARPVVALRRGAHASAVPSNAVFPAGRPAAFGLRLSSDGFQRAVRNPAIRRLARDRLSSRLIDRFVRDAYVKRGGTGPITKQDREDGKNLRCAFLDTPQGLLDLANETPAPVGSGSFAIASRRCPTLSDFDIEVPELDLWLGNDRIEGRARVTGEVNGFGFTAHLRFRGRPVLVQQPLSIEIQNVEIDDPDIEIELPAWLEWAFGALVGVFAGPIAGMIAGFLFSSIIASLVEAFIPSDLGSKLPPLPGQRATPPRGSPLPRRPSCRSSSPCWAVGASASPKTRARSSRGSRSSTRSSERVSARSATATPISAAWVTWASLPTALENGARASNTRIRTGDRA